MGTTRRVVLGVLGGAGVLVVGYALWPSHRMERITALDAKAGQRFLGNWIKIGSDNSVTVVIPHCDMGTGIFTGLKQMAAEELDLDFDKVMTEQAPPDALFANGALAEVFLMGPAVGSVPGFLKGTVDNTFRFLAAHMNLTTFSPDFRGYGGMQVTGGSSAIRGTGIFGTRVAAAAAREMLVKAAAARWNVDPSTCVTKAGSVVNSATGKSFLYGELVDDASKLTPSSSPTLKPRSEYKLVGTSVPRIDIPDKVDGKTAYGIDVKQPGMLYAAIQITPVFGAKLKAVDPGPAMSKKGVKKVISLDDAVVVVADRWWRARDAVLALSPKFDNGANGNVTSATIAARHTLALQGELKSDVKTGSGADALSTGRRVEATYNVPYLSHAPMEPMNATAIYNDKDGTLEVWSGTQDGVGSRAFCAQTAKLSIDAVTFHLLPSGGAFGRRLPGQWNFLTYAVQTAQAMPNVPIKLLWTREQDMTHDFYRPNVTSRFRGALGGDGMPVAWVNDYTTDDSANPQAHIPYAIPNQAISAGQVKTHVPTGPWRSVEASWHGFFTESFVDELAHAAGKDPLAYRRAMLQDKPRHLATLNLAAEKAGWGTTLPAGTGRGIAIVESFGSVVAQVAEVQIAGDGTFKVKKIVCAIDCGMAVNPDGVKAQMESGIIYGLTAALYDEITIDKGAVVQQSFPDYEMMHLADTPEIEVYIHESDGLLGGAGEPGVPPAAPAVANAVFAATGKRIRDLPFKNHTLTASLQKGRAA